MKCPDCGAELLLNPFRYVEGDKGSAQYNWCFRCNKQFKEGELKMADFDGSDQKVSEELEEDQEAYREARKHARAEIELSESQKKIAEVCDDLKEFLLEKNRKYGDSALNPIRVFSKADAREQILVRIDDKLNRIKNRQNDEDEDVIKDLAGYLILLLVSGR